MRQFITCIVKTFELDTVKMKKKTKLIDMQWWRTQIKFRYQSPKTNATVTFGDNSMSPFQVSNQFMSKTQSLWQQNLLSPATWQLGLSLVELLSKFPESPNTSVPEWNANAFLCAVKWAAVKSQAVHSDPLQPMAFSLLTTQRPQSKPCSKIHTN